MLAGVPLGWWSTVGLSMRVWDCDVEVHLQYKGERLFSFMGCAHTVRSYKECKPCGGHLQCRYVSDAIRSTFHTPVTQPYTLLAKNHLITSLLVMRPGEMAQR